jgi:hypothetical protein
MYVSVHSQRLPDRAHDRDPKDIGTLVFVQATLQRERPLEEVSATIHRVVEGDRDLDARKWIPFVVCVQPDCYRGAGSQRRAQEVIRIEARRRAAASVGASNRER